MTTKDTNMDELHDAACTYAMTLVAYHLANKALEVNDTPETKQAQRDARDELYAACNMLNNLTQEIANS